MKLFCQTHWVPTYSWYFPSISPSSSQTGKRFLVWKPYLQYSGLRDPSIHTFSESAWYLLSKLELKYEDEDKDSYNDKDANRIRRSVILSLHMRPTVWAKIWRLVGCSKLLFWYLKLLAGTIAFRICMTCYGKVDRLAGKLILSKKNHLKTPKIMDNFSDRLTLEGAGGQTDHTMSAFRPPLKSLG